MSLTALYANVKRTEPALLRALVHGSARRLAPVAAGLKAPQPSGLAVAHH